MTRILVCALLGILVGQCDAAALDEVTATPLRGIFRDVALPDHAVLRDDGIPESKLLAARKIVLRDIATPVSVAVRTEINDEANTKSDSNCKIMSLKMYYLKPTPTIDDISILVPIQDDWIDKPLKTTLTITRADGTDKKETATLEVKFAPERKWELFLVHNTHLDVGYTHTQAEVLDKQVQWIHNAIKYIDETRDYPEDAKFRFHPEGMWAIDEFLKRATPDEKQALVRAARARDLHIDGLYAQPMTGLDSEEELFEQFAFAARFCREHNIPLDSAMQTDTPGFTWGFVTAMAQNGIKYFTSAPNRGHRVGRHYETWDNTPFWLESPSGKERVLCWTLDTGYSQFHKQPFGHQISAKEVFLLVSGDDAYFRHGALTRIDGKRVIPFEDIVVIRYGIEADNGQPNRILSDSVKAWNEEYIYPKLIIARNSDAMRRVEERYGAKLPVLRGDHTGYWEDGAASTSEATAINRRSKERLLQALALWGMLKPKQTPFSDVDAAWTDLIMYDEHTWGAHNSIKAPDSDFVKQQDDYKQEHARRGARRVHSILADAVSDTKSGLSIANTLHWDIKGVRILGDDLLPASTLPELSFWKDNNGNVVTVQVIQKTAYAHFAQPLPAMSVVSLTPLDTKPTLDSSLFINAETGEMGNQMVTLTIDKESGAISSIKQIGIDHDLVNAGDDGNRGINDYLHIIGRDAKKNRNRIKGDEGGEGGEGTVKLTVLASGPIAASMLIESPAPNCKTLRRRVTVFFDSEKIHIENVLDKEMERRPEGTFFAFPFNVPHGTWRVDMPWSMVEVDRDQLPGACRNYYPVQRYCTLAASNVGINWVTIDAPMVQFAPILYSPAWDRLDTWRERFEDGEPHGTLYSWVCNNHWETNYKAGQDGELRFEYWIWGYSNRYENAQAQLFARSLHQPPLLVPTSQTAASLLTLGNTFVGVTSVRPCRDASGAVLVRLFNMSQEPQETTLTFRNPKATVSLSNPLEDRLSVAPAKLSLAPFETVTLRVEP